MPVFKKKKPEAQKEASSPPNQGDDALLRAVRSILVGQERGQLEALDEKLNTWQNEVSASEKAAQIRFENILAELEGLKERAQETEYSTEANASELRGLQRKSKDTEEGLVERLTPVMTNLIKQTIQDSPHDMAEALGPVMGSAIRQQIRTQKDDIVDALYPVIGETISKSVSEAINELIRNLDRRMRKHSPAERVAAQLQGVSAGELFFRDNLPYQISRVFIIHRKSGLLLAQTSPSGELRDDLDMISGMLTAIRDFAKDSLGEEEELNEIKHGEEFILLQTSQEIYVAAVLNGTIPQGYNALSRLVVSEINAKHERELRDFDGNMDNLPLLADELRPLLYPYDILKPAGMSSKQKKSAFTILIALLLLLTLSIFSCIFTIRLWPYAFPTATPQPTHTPTLHPTCTPQPSPTIKANTPTPTVTPTLRPDQGIAIGNVNIRSGPGTENTVLDILYEGERFIILEKDDDWLYIRRDVEGKTQIEGWVNQQWIIR